MSQTGMNLKRTSEQTGATQGFTLLELLIVMLIFTIFAGATSSALYRSFSSSSIDMAARDVLDALALARQRAILESTGYGVQITVKGNSYRLITGSDVAANSARSIPGHWGQSRHLLPPLSFVGADRTVFFHPDGTSSAAEISIQSPKENRTISVNPMTGQGSISEAEQRLYPS